MPSLELEVDATEPVELGRDGQHRDDESGNEEDLGGEAHDRDGMGSRDRG